jgi:uncharacterized protein
LENPIGGGDCLLRVDILQLTDLHISRLFPASWVRAVVERSNELRVDLIVITGDLIDGALDARRTDIEPLRD